MDQVLASKTRVHDVKAIYNMQGKRIYRQVEEPLRAMDSI